MQPLSRLTLKTPKPPGVNQMYVHTRRGVFPTTKYADWTKGPMADSCRDIGRPAIKHCVVAIRAHILYNQDIDNLIKPILDGLQKHGVLQDDRYVEAVGATRDKSLPKHEATICVMFEPEGGPIDDPVASLLRAFGSNEAEPHFKSKGRVLELPG